MFKSTPSPKQAVDLLCAVQKLKTTKRTGWVKRDVQGPESIADHMYRMALMGMIIRGTEYDHVRCIKLALIHDIAECFVGDITPTCGVSDVDKYNLESDAIKELKALLGGDDMVAASELEELWHEYERGETKEAALVKDFDKLEMILQAHEYESTQEMTLQEFFDSTAGKWRTDLGKSWAEEIYKRREGNK